MDYSYEYAMQSGVGIVLFVLLYMMVACGIGIALYVLRSLGIYTIAKRRGINHPWFAWVPVLDNYLLGCISDQFRYVVKGEIRNKRKLLLGLNIVLAVIYAVLFVFYFSLMGNVISMSMRSVTGEAEMMNAIMGPAMGILITALVMMMAAIVAAVFRYMALYDLYTSCCPQNNVLFLVLGIFFNVTEPFFIFFNRKKDEGMPPRKDSPQAGTAAAPVVEIPQPVPETDPWDLPDSE